MARNAEVDAWFKDLDHPLKKAMQRTRQIVLGADSRITEAIKWKSPTFMFGGNLASIEPRSKKQVSVLFHQGAALPKKLRGLEGGGGTVRYMRFEDLDDVNERRSDLEAAIRAACELNASKG